MSALMMSLRIQPWHRNHDYLIGCHLLQIHNQPMIEVSLYLQELEEKGSTIYRNGFRTCHYIGIAISWWTQKSLNLMIWHFIISRNKKAWNNIIKSDLYFLTWDPCISNLSQRQRFETGLPWNITYVKFYRKW